MGCTLHEITDPSHRVKAKPLSSRQENRTFSSSPSSIRSELIHTQPRPGRVFICWRNIGFDYLMTLRGNNWKAMLRIRRVRKSTNDRWSSVIGHICGEGETRLGHEQDRFGMEREWTEGHDAEARKGKKQRRRKSEYVFETVTFLLRLEIILTWCNGFSRRN